MCPLAIEPGPFSFDGLKIGHAEDREALTGCTVLIFEKGARGAVDIRGGAPGTREAAALDPLNVVSRIHGLLLTGGSAFGLDAAGGVMRYLEERGIGFETPAAIVPIVPAAVIYDLGIGDARRRPDFEMGYRAAEAAAVTGGSEGNAGVGCGATVGKFYGPAGFMKSGIGMASARLRDGCRVGVLVVVNAFGDVVDPSSGRILAGCRAPDGSFADTLALVAAEASRVPHAPATSTTLAAVLTDLPLTRTALGRVARMAHDGLARAIRPVHTQWDGDVVYAVSIAADEAPERDGSAAGAVAVECVAQAIVGAVLAAESAGGAPAARDRAEHASPPAEGRSWPP